MKRWLGRLSFFLGGLDRTILRIIVILSLALLVFLLELLRFTFFEESSLLVWGIVSVFIALIASFFISRFIFNSIDRLHEKNVNRMRELGFEEDS